MIRSTLQQAYRKSTPAVKSNGALRFMGGKEIKFGVDGRAAMLKGVDTLADAVQVSFSSAKDSRHIYSASGWKSKVAVLKFFSGLPHILWTIPTFRLLLDQKVEMQSSRNHTEPRRLQRMV